MLKRTIRTTKRVAVKVAAFKWHGVVTGVVAGFKCCACGGKLGDTLRWGSCWDDDRGVSMRLCNKCALEAEKSVNESVPQ